MATIEFSLRQAAKVSMAVYNEQGQLVRELARGIPRSAGLQQFTWDGRNNDGDSLPLGTYSWKSLATSGLQANYVMSLGNTWPISTTDLKYSHSGGPGSHGGPTSVAIDSTGCVVLTNFSFEWPNEQLTRTYVWDSNGLWVGRLFDNPNLTMPAINYGLGAEALAGVIATDPNTSQVRYFGHWINEARIYEINGWDNIVRSSGSLMLTTVTEPLSPQSINDYAEIPAGTGTGLTAEYFDNAKFTGSPLLTRIDALLDFHWGLNTGPSTSPLAAYGGKSTGYSIRWTGQIEPRQSGIYSFVGPHNFQRVWINGNQVDGDTIHNGINGIIRLKAGIRYQIRVEYSTYMTHPTTNHSVKLQWVEPAGTYLISATVVPTSQLYNTTSPTTLNALIKLAGNLNWPTARNAILGLGSFKEIKTIGILVKKLISIMIRTLVKGIGFINLTYQEYNILKTFSALGDVAVTPLKSMATYAPYYANIPNTSYLNQTGVAALRALGAISGSKSLLVLKNIIQNIKIPIAYRLSAIDVVVTRTDIEAINILIQALNDSNLRTYVAKILADAVTDIPTKDVYLATWINHPERKNNSIIIAALRASLVTEKNKLIQIRNI